jgi:hypothetical protein
MNSNPAIKKYKCGTLEFTVFQIWSLFFWMLWGAVGMSMLGSTFNSATPFLYRNYGLSDTFIAVIIGDGLCVDEHGYQPDFEYSY